MNLSHSVIVQLFQCPDMVDQNAVKLFATSRMGSMVEFTIRDFGVGLSEEALRGLSISWLDLIHGLQADPIESSDVVLVGRDALGELRKFALSPSKQSGAV